MKMTEEDLHIIENALRVAADRYAEHATTMRADAKFSRLAEQFDRQEREARALLEQIIDRED